MRPNIWAVTLMLGAAAAAAHLLPRPKYQSPEILSKLHVPKQLGLWQGEDISTRFNLDDDRYKFISEVFMRIYKKYAGLSFADTSHLNTPQLSLLILDAGNFHNPRVCFKSSGFKIRDLEDKTIDLDGKALKLKLLFASKNTESYLLAYWICMDGEIVDWPKQKILQLRNSLLNQKKVGLMVRLDIPAEADRAEDALALADDFLKTLYRHLTPEETRYLFGTRP